MLTTLRLAIVLLLICRCGASAVDYTLPVSPATTATLTGTQTISGYANIYVDSVGGTTTTVPGSASNYIILNATTSIDLKPGFSALQGCRFTATLRRPPTISVAATGILDPTDTFATVNVLGADDAGEGDLVYGWSMVSGPSGASPVVASNNSNASKHTTITFNRSGSYSLQCVITDSSGLAVTAPLALVVPQVAATLAISPVRAEMASGTVQPFTASGTDQFSQTYTAGVTWSVSGGGTITTGGQFTATTTGGPFDLAAVPPLGVQAHQVFAIGAAPTASPLSVTTTMNTTVPLPLVATSSVGTLSFVFDTQPTNGQLIGQPPNLAYQPNAGFTGSDSFVYHVSDGYASSSQATVGITVTASTATLDRTATPLVIGSAFNASQWASDSTYRSTYLAGIEPGRVWQSATPGASVPAIIASTARRFSGAAGGEVALTVKTGVPGSPVTFTCMGDGYFYQNNQNSVTVQADGGGFALAYFICPSSGEIPILAASPLSSDIVRFVVAVHP